MKAIKKKHLYASAIALAFIIGAFFLYGQGYRLGRGGITQTNQGEIRLTVPEPGARIFLDNKRKTTTTHPNEEIVFAHLEDRVYTLLVAPEKSFPWYKAIDLSQKHTTSLTSFSVPQTMNHNVITPETAEYQSMKTLIEHNKTPTEYSKLRSKSGRIDIWIDEQTKSINAVWLGQPEDIPRSFCATEQCAAHLIIFRAGTPIRSLDFYHGRDDVLLVAIGNSVSALELDTSAPQNFQPIFTGENPRFKQPEDGTLLIQSGAALVMVRY